MSTTASLGPIDAEPFHYSIALVRPVPTTFFESLKEQPPATPIDLALARSQHSAYIDLLRQLVHEVVEVEADDQYPDCCFIEDTAIVVRDIAVICRPGHPARRGEEVAVHRTLQSFSFLRLHSIDEPGTLDGGDCLFTGNELLVGLSRRTNQSAIDQLRSFLPLPVHALPVTAGLHLKSLISHLSPTALIAANNAAGHTLTQYIQSQPQLAHLTFIHTSSQLAANVLRIANTVVVQSGHEVDERLIGAECERLGLTVRSVRMDEMAKADGALTCSCILIKRPPKV